MESIPPAVRNARARAFMFEHLDRPIRVHDIAAAAGISDFHFARGFKEQVGCSPHAYLTLLRLARAKLLLATTQTPLAEVARRTGFKTQAHFTGVFAKLVGTTPKRYRMIHALAQEALMNPLIDVMDDHERLVWARLLRVPEGELARLVETVGVDPKAIREVLKRRQLASTGGRQARDFTRS